MAAGVPTMHYIRESIDCLESEQTLMQDSIMSVMTKFFQKIIKTIKTNLD